MSLFNLSFFLLRSLFGYSLISLSLSSLSVPAIDKILPTEGLAQGGFSLAVFGKHFQQGSGFKVRLLHTSSGQFVDAKDIEFHGTVLTCNSETFSFFEKEMW